VVRERVRKAEELLLRGGLPVAAVAREVGFADQGHLSRHTKRLLGATPGEILAEGKAERGGAARGGEADGGGSEEGKNLRNQSKILQDPAALPA
jgi:AraC-like DNA-binding protein